MNDKVVSYNQRNDIFNKIYDVAIIGGGIVGMATAMALMESHPDLSLVVLEAEKELASHQTGHNSGVIHSGLYYKPGSLKALNCAKGRETLYNFCAEHDIPYDRCGKVVVATSKAEIQALDELERRGKANGLQGLRRLQPEEIREIEPHVNGIDGLHVPETGIVDYTTVTKKYAELVASKGGEIVTSARVINYRYDAKARELLLGLSDGMVRCRNLINCAGLQSDRVARMCGVKPGLKIVPFRGEYYELIPERQYLVKHLIYPVPDPQYPFLGVHFTRMIKGGVEAGPNAFVAFKREGYKVWQFSIKDMLSYTFFSGFWRMALKHWRMGGSEFLRTVSRKAFVNALQKLIPEITPQDVVKGGAGIRAQALEANGSLVDDFRIVEAERMIHVLNAPSPAATASISIGQDIAAMAAKNFDLS
jgi:L-2-hydroxyglutarate oxidase